MDKVLEFEKALAAHAQKYHRGTAHWRVFIIQSGSDIGSYHISKDQHAGRLKIASIKSFILL